MIYKNSLYTLYNQVGGCIYEQGSFTVNIEASFKQIEASPVFQAIFSITGKGLMN